jgi:hypothetical protein
MTHTLTLYQNGVKELSVTETDNKKCILNVSSISNDSFEQVELDLKELHSFIGTLLHVQQKMKGGK